MCVRARVCASTAHVIFIFSRQTDFGRKISRRKHYTLFGCIRSHRDFVIESLNASHCPFRLMSGLFCIGSENKLNFEAGKSILDVKRTNPLRCNQIKCMKLFVDFFSLHAYGFDHFWEKKSLIIMFIAYDGMTHADSKTSLNFDHRDNCSSESFIFLEMAVISPRI